MRNNIKVLEKHITTLVKNYRKEWKEDLWESENIEEFGFNEFIGGKAEGCEEGTNYDDLVKSRNMHIATTENQQDRSRAALAGWLFT